MLTFCVNEEPLSTGSEAGLKARLLFICKVEGKDAAIPRVMHKHDERFEMMFIVEGKGTYNIDGKSYQVTRGDMLIFNRGTLHDENPVASADLLIFSCGIDSLNLNGLPLNHLTGHSQIAVMPSEAYYEDIKGLYLQMWEHVSAKGLYHRELGNSYLHVLLMLYRKIWAGNKPQHADTVEVIGTKIKDFIDVNYKDEILFNQITKELGMNHFYLAHLFKNFSGYSPKQYQTRRRIGEAQSLLLSTEWSITEVANAVGYENVNNFHRIFNNMIGIAPARYKRFLLKGQEKN